MTCCLEEVACDANSTCLSLVLAQAFGFVPRMAMPGLQVMHREGGKRSPHGCASWRRMRSCLLLHDGTHHPALLQNNKPDSESDLAHCSLSAQVLQRKEMEGLCLSIFVLTCVPCWVVNNSKSLAGVTLLN